MTLALTITMTAVGLDRFTAAQLGDGIDLQISSVGLTDADFIIAPTLDALPGEFRRIQTISGEVIGSNTVHMMIRDTEPLAYTVRGLGLFLADGTLFAVYGQPEPIFEKSVLTTLLLALDITFPTAAIDALSFGDTNFLNPPATEAQLGVARIATDVMIDAGIDDARFVTARKLARRLTGFVTLAMRGVANGVASLAADGKVPPGQLRVYQVNGHLGDVVLTAADVGAPKLSTTIVANGILKGGGSLDESREIRLDAATPAQIRAGQAVEGVAITPAGLAAAGVPYITSSYLGDQNGYREWSDGLIECWGFVQVPAQSVYLVHLPTPHEVFVIPVGSSARASADEQNVGVQGPVGSPPTGFNIRNANVEAVTFYWQTKGR